MAFDYRRASGFAQPHQQRISPPQQQQQQQQQALQHYNLVQKSEPIPTPPPLPPQRVSDVAKSVFDRLRYGPKKYATSQNIDSHQPDSEDQMLLSQKFGPTVSQSTSHKTGLKIRALDINQTRTHVVLAGGKILKTVRVDLSPPNCSEDFNLRAAAVNYAWDSNNVENDASIQRRAGKDTQEIINVQRETFDIEDVAWSNGVFSDYIATAASNGKIMLYNLKRPGVEVARLHEHYRQVHKVDFNPIEGAFLLSGSQDGTVRLWDLRILKKDVMASSSRDTFPGRNDGVRHVKWSPRNTFVFAFGTDNGTVQRWDTRYNKGPRTKISAHFETCNSIDWHPDGKHLASAGKDQTVKVWNLASESRRQKAVFNFRTPREVQNVRWRPPCIITDSQDQSAKFCTHLATSYRHYPVVHVWDLRRPFMPFREIHHRVNQGTTDMLWRSKDLLWLVGPDGEFSQTDMAFTPKTISRRPMSIVECDPLGEMTFFSKSRPNSHFTPSMRLGSEDPSNGDEEMSKAPCPLPLGASPADDSLDEQFLSSTYRLRRHSRTPSTRSVKSLGATPPTSEDKARTVTVDLEVGINISNASRPLQASKSGPVPGALSTPVFTYLAMKFKLPPYLYNSSAGFFTHAESFFEQNAVYSQRASYYRDAQTWKILGMQISRQIRLSAEANRRKCLNQDEQIAPKKGIAVYKRNGNPKTENTSSLEENRLKQKHSRNLGRQFSAIRESASNVATPIVRPVKDADQGIVDGHHFVELSTNEAGNSTVRNKRTHTGSDPFNLPNLSEGTFLNDNDEAPRWKHIPTQSDQQKALALINDYKVQPRTPLNLEQPLSDARHIIAPPRLDRQLSTDSVTFFSESVSSRQKLSHSGSYLSEMSDSGQTNSSVGESDRGLNSTEFQGNFSSFVSASSSGPSPYHRVSRSSSLNGPIFKASSSGKIIQPEGSREESIPSIRSSDTKNSRLSHGLSEEATQSTNMSVGEASSSVEKNNMSDRPPGLERLTQSDYLVSVRGESYLAESSNSLLRMNQVSQSESDLSRMKRLGENGPANARAEIQNTETHPFEVSDFLDPSLSLSKGGGDPVSAKDMVQQLLSWYTEHSNSQMASHILLLSIALLAPPDSQHVRENFMTRDMMSLHDYLTTVVSFSPDAATQVLTSYHLPLQSIKLSPTFAESILSTYHEHLMALRLLQPATIIRRLSYPAFPSVYEQSLKDVEIRTLCLSCKSPINNPLDKMRCETCSLCQAVCAICFSQDSPYELPRKTKKQKQGRYSWGDKQAATKASNIDDAQQPVYRLAQFLTRHESNDGEQDTEPITRSSRLWTACLLCNHSNHAACLHAWFSEHRGISQGACPVEGCVCDCTTGAYRNNRLANLEAQERARGNDNGNSATKKSNTTSNGTRAPLSERVRSGSNPDLTSSLRFLQQQQYSQLPNVSGGAPGGLATGMGLRRGDDWTVGESRAVKELRSSTDFESSSSLYTLPDGISGTGNGVLAATASVGGGISGNTSGHSPGLVDTYGRRKGRSTSATNTVDFNTSASSIVAGPSTSTISRLAATNTASSAANSGTSTRNEEAKRVRVLIPEAPTASGQKGQG